MSFSNLPQLPLHRTASEIATWNRVLLLILIISLKRLSLKAQKMTEAKLHAPNDAVSGLEITGDT